jgi:hypothetical protein
MLRNTLMTSTVSGTVLEEREVLRAKFMWLKYKNRNESSNLAQGSVEGGGGQRKVEGSVRWVR